MMDRRTTLGGFAAGAVAAAGMVGAKESRAAMQEGYTLPKPELDGGMLVNRGRAHDVLEEYGLAGMIAAVPMNVYYLTNMVTIGVKFRSETPGFATFARDQSQPIFLVTTSSATRQMANGDRETAELMPYGFGGPDEIERDESGVPVEPPNGTARFYNVRPGVELTAREQRWAAAQDKQMKSLAAGPAWGLARALKAQGITKGRVAVDDMNIAALLAQTDLVDVECVPGYDIFRLIRMVKTDQEIAYQRIAGRNNGDAAMAAIRAIEVGMTVPEIEQVFRLECAKRGNDMTSLVAGFSSGGFPDEGKMAAGKPFLIDAVSHFRQYHGDFARTFIIGDPPKDVQLRARANQLAREAVFELVKPGVKFSKLRQVAFDTMVKAGIPDYAVFVTPHSVGLQHDDNPPRLAAFGVDRFDHELQENMVMTIDLPYVEIGWGCGHNEDLFRVTKTGYEMLNTEDSPLVVL